MSRRPKAEKKPKRPSAPSKAPSRPSGPLSGTCGTQGEGEHYPFDDQFLRRYEVLLTMLLERGYSGDGLIGVEPVPPDHEPSDQDLDDGIVGHWRVQISVEKTVPELIDAYAGLENFSMRLSHQDASLNMLVYYLIPEVESHGSVQERKQLSQAHVEEYVNCFKETPGFGRLLLISKAKLSADAATRLGIVNAECDTAKNPCLVEFILASFFDFNLARWIMQPHDVRILRGDEKRQLLDELAVPPERRGQEESLVLQMSDADPLAIYFGARADELMTYVREIPVRQFHMRIVVPEVELQ
jgi:hypothetical protein